MNYRNSKFSNNTLHIDREKELDEKLEHIFDDMKGRDNNRDRHALKMKKDKDYRRKYEDDYED